MSQNLATSDVPFVGDLGLGTSGEPGTVRSLWKQYTKAVWPHAVRCVRNFMLNTIAEGRNEEDDEANASGPSMTCAATLDDIERVMAGDRQDRKLDGEESQLIKSVGKSTDVAMQVSQWKKYGWHKDN